MTPLWIVSHVFSVVGFLLALLLLSGFARERRAPASTLAWLLVVVLAPYVGVPLYLVFGGRKVKRMSSGKAMLYLTPPRAPRTEAEGLERILQAAGAPVARGGNRVRLLPSGEEAFAALIAMIAQAEQSIDIATFILATDEVGMAVLAALEAKARAGVRVRLLIDALFAFRAEKRQLERLTRVGGEVAFFMPVLHVPFRGHANLRNHRKSMVVDGQRALIGGMNLAHEYMGPTPDPARWRDVALELVGPSVEDIGAVFRSDWAFAARTARPDEPPPLCDPQPDGARVQAVASGPDVAGDPIYDALLSSLFAARQRIWIATPYFIPDEALTRGLVLAARRGVDVRIVVPARSNHWMADVAGGSYLRQIAAAGGRILRYVPGMMHAKVTVFDQNLATLGSANMDMRSLFLDYELSLFFFSAHEVALLADWFVTLSQQCEERAEQGGRARVIAENVGRLLAPLV